jgi:hypothetical protein
MFKIAYFSSLAATCVAPFYALTDAWPISMLLVGLLALTGLFVSVGISRRP